MRTATERADEFVAAVKWRTGSEGPGLNAFKRDWACDALAYAATAALASGAPTACSPTNLVELSPTGR